MLAMVRPAPELAVSTNTVVIWLENVAACDTAKTRLVEGFVRCPDVLHGVNCFGAHVALLSEVGHRVIIEAFGRRGFGNDRELALLADLYTIVSVLYQRNNGEIVHSLPQLLRIVLNHVVPLS